MANDKNFKVKNGVTVGTDVVMEGTTFNTTLTKTTPTANRTATLPDATGTVALTSDLTTYSIKATTVTSGASIDLDAAGASTATDSVSILGSGIASVARTDASTITITATEADTLSTVTGRGATTATAISITNTTASSSTTTGALTVSGGAGIAGNTHVGGNLVVTGDLTINGTATTVNSTTITVDDKNIVLGSVDTPTNITADGGGITLRGDTDKTFNWVNATTAWTSSEDLNLLTGKTFKINDTSVLSSTQVLGKGFTNAAGEIVTTDATQTLSNKSLSGGSASNLTGLSMATGVAISEFSTDDTLAGDSTAVVPTESAVKGYVDGALTTYSVKASSTTGGANLDLDAAGANTGTDSVKFAGAGSVSIAQTDANTITVTGATLGDGGLTLQVGGTAAATNNTVTVSTGTGFTANAASASTYELRIGPALTAFVTQMTGAGTGFLRKNGADTFSVDTNTYLTSYTEADTLATVTGRGATTATDITLGNGTTTSNTYFGGSLNNYLITTGNGAMRIKAKDQTTTYGRNVYIEAGNSSAANEFGGAVLLNAGDGTGTNGEGGGVTVYSGDGVIPGGITLQAGSATALNVGTATGGTVTIQAGGSTVTSGAAVGGNVVIKGGDGPFIDGASKTGGSVYISGGGISGSNTIRYGNIYIGVDQNGSGGGTQEVRIGNAASKNYINGITEYTTSTEVLNTKTSATGTVAHNLTEGNTWYHSSISANFTANFTNVPTTDNRTLVCTLLLVQGATAYIPNAVQIDGVSQTINWTGSAGVPAGDANDVNIATFVLIRRASTWTVLGSVVNNPVTSTLQSATASGATTSDAVSITNATASSSTTTGALQVAGGAGIGGNLYVGGTIYQTGSGVSLNSNGQIILDFGTILGGSVAGLTIKGDAAYSTNLSIGVAQNITRTGRPGGLSGAFIDAEGARAISFGTNDTERMAIEGDGTIIVRSAAVSTSTTTGALQVAGGVGIGGELWIGGGSGAVDVVSIKTYTDARLTIGVGDAGTTVSLKAKNLAGTQYRDLDLNGNNFLYLRAGGAVMLSAETTGCTLYKTTTLQQTTEVLNTKTSATGTVVHDFSTGAIWYHSSISASFTANFTNVPTTDSRSIGLSLVLSQGATAYIPSAVQIAGTAQTIKWQGGTAPTGNANKTDIVSFVLIRTGSAWIVLGSLSTYG